MLSISSWKAGIYGDQESKGVKFSFSELVLGFTKFCHVYRTITLSLHPYVRRSTTMWLTYDGIIPWPNLHPPWKFPLGLWRFLSNNVPKTTPRKFPPWWFPLLDVTPFPLSEDYLLGQFYPSKIWHFRGWKFSQEFRGKLFGWESCQEGEFVRGNCAETNRTNWLLRET